MQWSPGFRIPTMGRRTSLWWRLPLQLHDAPGYRTGCCMARITSTTPTLLFPLRWRLKIQETHWPLSRHSASMTKSVRWRPTMVSMHIRAGLLFHLPSRWCSCCPCWWSHLSIQRNNLGWLLLDLPSGGKREESERERTLWALHVRSVTFLPVFVFVFVFELHVPC